MGIKLSLLPSITTLSDSAVIVAVDGGITSRISYAALVTSLASRLGSTGGSTTTPHQISVDADKSQAEGAGGSTTTYNYTVTLTPGTTNTSPVVSFSTAGYGSNPANAADFQGGALPSGSYTFTGAGTHVFPIVVTNDTGVEPDEQFQVTFACAGGNTVTARGTIVNDDASQAALPTRSGLTRTAHWDASTITGNDGDLLSSWTDKVAGIAASTAVSADRPTLKTSIAGKPAVRFPQGSATRLKVGRPAALTAIMASPTTWSAVLIFANAQGSGSFVSALGDNSDTGIHFGPTATAIHWSGYSKSFPGTSDETYVMGYSAYAGDNGAGRGRLYIEGTNAYGPSTQQISSDKDLYIGGGDTAGGKGVDSFFGDLREIIIWGHAAGQGLTPAEMLQVQKYACDRYSKPYPWTGMTYYPVFDGDSVGMYGADFDNIFPQLIANAKGWKLGGWQNVCKPGANMNSTTDANSIPNVAPVDVDAIRAVVGIPLLLFFDEYDNTGAVSTAALNRQYMVARKTANSDTKIVLATSKARFNTNDQTRVDFTNALVSDPGVADKLVRTDLNTHIGVLGAAGTTGTASTYFLDGAHLNTAGHTEAANERLPYINANGTLTSATWSTTPMPAASSPYTFTNSGIDSSYNNADASTLPGLVQLANSAVTIKVKSGKIVFPGEYDPSAVGHTPQNPATAILQLPYTSTSLQDGGMYNGFVGGGNSRNMIVLNNLQIYSANDWEPNFLLVVDGTRGPDTGINSLPYAGHLNSAAPVVGDVLGLRYDPSTFILELLIKRSGQSTFVSVGATRDVRTWGPYVAGKLGSKMGVNNGWGPYITHNTTTPIGTFTIYDPG